MKKLIIAIVVAIVLFAAIAAGLISYVKPAEDLDLDYQEVSVAGKLMDIVKSRKLEVELTEQDINNIVKKQLAAHKMLPHDIQIEGAKLTLRGNVIAADVNLRWHDQVPVGAQLNFILNWNNPNLEIRHVSTQVKGITVPSEWLQIAPIEIPIESHLPRLVGLKDVAFEEKAIHFYLKLLR